MTEGNEEVKEFVERVEVGGSAADEDTDDDLEEKETPGEPSEPKEPEDDDSSDEEDEGSDEVVTPPQKAKVADDGLKDVPGETPRERALRLQVTQLRAKARQERMGEIVGQPKVSPPSREMSDEQKQVLSKYKPEDIAALRDVIPLLATEMGFVREDQLLQKEVVKESNSVFDTFMTEHPEYSEENDPDGTLWEALKEEYTLFETPKNPQQLRKILERAHKEVFGIQPAGDLQKVKAAQEKVKVASHGSGSKPQVQARREEGLVKGNPTGARKDMLKGFSEEDLESMGLN